MQVLDLLIMHDPGPGQEVLLDLLLPDPRLGLVHVAKDGVRVASG
ncbi:MAG TPA: hypothetical protein VEB65_01330 [Solirubrobacterales bacterium]|nr:hypothetical protein [Solirubrobacterales bacterium]